MKRDGEAAPRPMRRWAYPALAFLTGTFVTVFEFSAPSLFRAFFGQTIYVWANVIGVILGALAVGYAVGGRWADRTRTTAPLFGVLAFAGLYGLLTAWMGPWVAGALAGPEEYTQDAALRAFFAESLAASLLLFGPPLVALGMATPLLVQRASTHWPVGSAAGLIFGVGTLGSITGIYLTTYLLIDLWGVRATVAGSGAALVLLAAGGFLVAGRRRAAGISAAASLLVLLGTAPPWGALPPDGARTLLTLESPYQLVRVIDRPGGAGRWLVFDEGMGTYHSILRDPASGATGAYYDAFAYAPEWAGGGGPFRICILGNAAGTMSQLFHERFGADQLEIEGVEIDRAVTQAARAAMGLDDAAQPSLRIFHADGRTFLRSRPEASYDLILLDAYARQVSIPAALVTREFFELVRSRLTDRGLLLVNVGALRTGGPLVRAVADTMAAGFGSPVARAPLRDQQNVLLIAARRGAPPPPPAGIPLGVEESFGLHVAGGVVLTDDACPIERLTARDLLLR